MTVFDVGFDLGIDDVAEADEVSLGGVVLLNSDLIELKIAVAPIVPSGQGGPTIFIKIQLYI